MANITIENGSSVLMTIERRREMDEKLNELIKVTTKLQEDMVKLKKEVLTLQDAVIQLQLAEKHRLLERLGELEDYLDGLEGDRR